MDNTTHLRYSLHSFLRLCRYSLLYGAVLFLAPQTKAQFNVYHPFPDSNAVWGMSAGCNIDWGCFSSQYIQNFLDGDTVIDGLNYRIVHEATSAVSGSCCGVESDLGAGYLRDDTIAHKVYWRIPGMDSDSLLYDFTLEVGDTLRGLYGNTGLCAEGVVTVHSIDSIMVGPSFHRKINFYWDACFGPSIIEGIGSTTGLTFCTFMNKSFGTVLTCFMVDGELLYTAPCGAPDLTACGELPLGIAANGQSRKPDIAASPNPSTGIFTISQEAEQVSVYTAQGRLLFRQHGKDVDLSAYPPGLYHAVVRTAQGVGHVRLMVQR